MVLEELQKAVLLALYYKPGDWQSPITVAPMINMEVQAFGGVAQALKKLGLLESRTLSLRKPGARWEQRTTKKQYRLSDTGKAKVREMLEVIDGHYPRGKL